MHGETLCQHLLGSIQHSLKALAIEWINTLQTATVSEGACSNVNTIGDMKAAFLPKKKKIRAREMHSTESTPKDQFRGTSGPGKKSPILQKRLSPKNMGFKIHQNKIQKCS